MSEEAHQQQTNEYIEQHPGAIVDPVKAEIMANASKLKEEEVVNARNAALDAIAYPSEDNLVKKIMKFPIFENTGRSPEMEEAVRQGKKALLARGAADEQAQNAADIYDAVKKI